MLTKLSSENEKISLLYIALRCSVVSSMEPCTALRTDLCRSILSILPRCLSTTRPRQMVLVL